MSKKMSADEISGSPNAVREERVTDVVEKRQRLYRKVRLPEVVDEMKRIAQERKELAGKRKDTSVSEDERKKVNQRWSYLSMRTHALRTERTSLSEGSRREK